MLSSMRILRVPDNILIDSIIAKALGNENILSDNEYFEGAIELWNLTFPKVRLIVIRNDSDEEEACALLFESDEDLAEFRLRWL